jgi:hypothetical protein
MKEHKEFSEHSAAIAYNGAGVRDKVPGSPSNSIAVEREHTIHTFGYNTKDPVAIHNAHVAREERNGR